MVVKNAELLAENQDVVKAVLVAMKEIHTAMGTKLVSVAVEDEKRLLALRREYEGQRKLLAAVETLLIAK